MPVDPSSHPLPPDSYGQIHRQFQQVLSLVLSHFKSSEPVVARAAERFHQSLRDVLAPTQYVALFRRPEGLFLNDRALPDSYVLNRLFESGRCDGICFQSGIHYEEILACVDEMAHCLQGGSGSLPLGSQRDYLKHYYWIPAGQSPPVVQVESDLDWAKILR